MLQVAVSVQPHKMGMLDSATLESREQVNREKAICLGLASPALSVLTEAAREGPELFIFEEVTGLHKICVGRDMLLIWKAGQSPGSPQAADVGRICVGASLSFYLSAK